MNWACIFNIFVLKDLRKIFLKKPQKKMVKRNKYLERVRYHLQQKKFMKNTKAYSETSQI